MAGFIRARRRRSKRRQRPNLLAASELLEQKLPLGSLSVGEPPVDPAAGPQASPESAKTADSQAERVAALETNSGKPSTGTGQTHDSEREPGPPVSGAIRQVSHAEAQSDESDPFQSELSVLTDRLLDFADSESPGLVRFAGGVGGQFIPEPVQSAPAASIPRTSMPVGSGPVQQSRLSLADVIEAQADSGPNAGFAIVSGAEAGVQAPAIVQEPLSNYPVEGGTPGGATEISGWFVDTDEPVRIGYDFRDLGGFENQITSGQQARAEDALAAWEAATSGRVDFVRDTHSPAADIVTIGTGDLAAVDQQSGANGVLGVGGGQLRREGDEITVSGVAWLDSADKWDMRLDNGDVSGRFDYFTVVAHEIGHVLGFNDHANYERPDIMLSTYAGEQDVTAVTRAVANAGDVQLSGSGLELSTMVAAQLTPTEVGQILSRASIATASDDAIIAVVDRGGRVLGVRVEAGVRDAGGGVPNDALLSFMIDGALAKARTAAFFANGDPTNGDREGTLAPLTSRTVRFVSQSTVTQREVEANPNDPDPTKRGPGFVAPIGLGGHFPPEVPHTPHVDLFAIEHTNRDRFDHTKAGGSKNGRFRVKFDAGKNIQAPKSYGQISGRAPQQKPRGIGTLPGGVPIYADTNSDDVGDTLVGGIGVFFPGPDGYATHEQGFIPGIGQTEEERLNADKVLEAEFMAVVGAGGSTLAGVELPPPLNMPERFDIPFDEELTLVGINLEVIGPVGSIAGVRQLLDFGTAIGPGADSGTNQPVRPSGTTLLQGKRVPQFDLVSPRDAAAGSLTAADVQTIFDQANAAAERVRAAIRLEVIDSTIDSTSDIDPGRSQTRMVFAVTDLNGNVIGLHRMQDATFFSIDVAVAKARNVTYYADAAKLKAADSVPGVPAGTAFTNRTFRFLAEPRYPSGVDGSTPPEFSILNNRFIDPATAENIGAPRSFKQYRDTVLGFDAFVPGSNFRDTSTPRSKQNGIVFFPGSIPLYKNGQLVGGFGVSGDGVDQDDVVTFLGGDGFLPYNVAPVADEFRVDDVRLPFVKFLRNPFLD